MICKCITINTDIPTKLTPQLSSAYHSCVHSDSNITASLFLNSLNLSDFNGFVRMSATCSSISFAVLQPQSSFAHLIPQEVRSSLCVFISPMCNGMFCQVDCIFIINQQLNSTRVLNLNPNIYLGIHTQKQKNLIFSGTTPLQVCKSPPILCEFYVFLTENANECPKKSKKENFH